jgi:hypothetical protein
VLFLLPFNALPNSLLVTAGKNRGGRMSFIITNTCSFSDPGYPILGPLECVCGIWFWFRGRFSRSVTCCVVVVAVLVCECDSGDDCECDCVECDSRLGDREGA